MKMCPTGGLQPCWAEAGLEGLWTPRLAPQIGYCDYACNLCGQVCPTEAIVPLSIAEKQQVHIGLAAFDTTRCIPYAYGRDCMVCEEHCPIPDQGDLLSHRRGRGPQGAEACDQAAARRSGPLHRLRHLRERLSLQGPAGGAGPERQREPQFGPSADPARQRPVAVLNAAVPRTRWPAPSLPPPPIAGPPARVGHGKDHDRMNVNEPKDQKIGKASHTNIAVCARKTRQ